MWKEVDHSLCNYLAKLYHLHQYKNTRYHKFDEIHISDISSCPIRMVLDRLFEATPPCRLLYFLQEGLEWEAKAVNTLKQQFPTGEVRKIIKMKKRIVAREYEIIGTPDFYDYNNSLFIEIKWTRFNPNAIKDILRNKSWIITRVWPDFAYPLGVRKLLIWDSWYVQVAGYHYLIRKVLGRDFKPYIFANRGHDIDLIEIDTRYFREDDMDSKVEQGIFRVATLLRYYKDKLYAPLHGLEDVFWQHFRDMYCKLWNVPEEYAKVEYQCRYCPYFWMGVCPGLIPARVFYSKRFGWLWSIEEVERLKFLMGFSDTLQELIRSRDPELYRLLLDTGKENYNKIRAILSARHNDSDFIADMIRAVKNDCKFAWRLRPPRTRTVYLR